MNLESENWRSIAVAYDADDMQAVDKLFDALKIVGGAEGNRTVGYEIATVSEHADMAASAIKASDQYQTKALRVYVFDPPFSRVFSDEDRRLYQEWRELCRINDEGAE